MESDMHVGELAELYAAGALESHDRAIVERHIAQCPQCLRRTGEAEEAVLALERRFKVPQDFLLGAKPLMLGRSPNRLWPILAVAAALIVGFLIPRPQSRQNPATLAMIQSHFSHAQFSGSGPAAKVLYARDRSWYYVIVQGAHRYDVYGVREGRAELLGSTRPEGLTSELFGRPSRRFDAMDLRENGRTLERATLR